MDRPLDRTEHGAPCVFCGHSTKLVLFEARDYITLDRFRLLQCQQCQVVETHPQPASAEISKYYPDEYFGLSGRRFLSPGEWLIRLARVWRARAIHRYYRTPGRILDIGCGRGWMLSELKQLGWECHGTEWSETLVKRLQYDHLQVVREVDLGSCRFPDQFFDVVTLWHVFEHLANPAETLVEIHRILKPGGLVILATPDFGGWVSRHTQQFWFALDVPRHLYHYSRNTLPAIIEANGFRVIARRNLSIEQDLFGAVQSILNAMGFSYNKFYNSIRNDTARASTQAKSETLLQKLMFWPTTLALLAPSTLLALVLPVCESGGTIEVWGLKPIEPHARANSIRG